VFDFKTTDRDQIRQSEKNEVDHFLKKRSLHFLS